MKTLTEFAVVTIKNAQKTQQELTAAGKTAEELPAAMSEVLKVEGDKLTYLMNALETVGNKTEDLKRAVVFTLAEGEKAPSGAVQKGEQYYLVEYYPSLAPKRGERGDRDERGGRGARGGKGGRGDKRGGGRGGRDGDKRGPGGPGRGGERSERGERSAFGAPHERRPRPAAVAPQPAAPRTTPLKIIPKGEKAAQTENTAQTAAPAAAPSAAENSGSGEAQKS